MWRRVDLFGRYFCLKSRHCSDSKFEGSKFLRNVGTNQITRHYVREGLYLSCTSSLLATAVGCETNQARFAEGNIHNKTNSIHLFRHQQNNSIWYWYISVAMNFMANNNFTTTTGDLGNISQKDLGNECQSYTKKDRWKYINLNPSPPVGWIAQSV
jgi:hypothetical protein